MKTSKYLAEARAWHRQLLKRGGVSTREHLRLGGLVTIVEAMDYHFEAFRSKLEDIRPYIKAFAATARGKKPNAHPVAPDATKYSQTCRLAQCDMVAYLNRLGQFYYFAQAEKLLGKCSRIMELIPLRMKHSAHRSIDAPRDETPEEHENQAFAFGGFGHQFQDERMVFSFRLGSANIFFDPLTDHDIVMTEIVTALRACEVRA